jgi:uncharacterized protein
VPARRRKCAVTDRPPNHEVMATQGAQPGATITQWYDLIDRGRTAEACRLFHADIEWIEPEGSLYGVPGAALVGVTEVVSKVFSPLARDWSELRILRDLVLSGQPVIVCARYFGVHRASGRRLDAQVLHLWDVAAGRVKRYRGYADTLALHIALHGNTDVGVPRVPLRRDK